MKIRTLIAACAAFVSLSALPLAAAAQAPEATYQKLHAAMIAKNLNEVRSEERRVGKECRR